MACANPFTVINKKYIPGSVSSLFSYGAPYWSVPCGWCLNCRIDKRNFLEDVINFEHSRLGTGAFVTFTYDSNHIIKNTYLNDDNQIIMSISRKDARNFLYRIRSNLNYQAKKHGIKLPEYKYCYVQEYGDEKNRPHMHFIFLGLDFKLFKKLFQNSWKNGIVYSGPIQNGAIRYVLDYMDKFVCGSEARRLYTDKGLEKPYLAHSIGLANKFILSNFDFIKNHNSCYLSKHNKLRPIPTYHRNKYLGRVLPDYNKLSDMLKNYHVKSKKPHSTHGYSIKQMNEFRHQKALERQQNLIIQSRSNGRPADSPYTPLTPQQQVEVTQLANKANILTIPF